MKEKLISTASILREASSPSIEEFASKVDAMSSKLDAAMVARDDVQRLVGADNIEMMRNNHHNHFRYMESVLRLFDPAGFVDTILWVFRTYRSHGFQVAYWPAMLDTATEVMKQELSPEAYDEVAPLYQWMIVHIPEFTSLSENTESVWEMPPSHGHGEPS